MEDWPHVVTLEPGSAGLALARRLARRGARVTAIAPPGYEWEGSARGVEVVTAPFEPDGEPWLRALERLAADGSEAVVLPASDRGSELLVRARERLPETLRFFERIGDAHTALMDKDLADGIARAAGVLVPWTATIRTPQERDAALAAAPWPCVVKPVFSHDWRSRYGEERAFLARDAARAGEVLDRPLADGVPMLLSQYIPGGDDAVEEAIVVRLADGRYPVWFGCRKLRQSPRGFGATAFGESSLLPETTELARRVLDAAGFVGVAGVEAKRHAETGERYFLEVNVRMPGQWGLGDACGTEASPRLVAALAGAPLPTAIEPRPGVGFSVPESDAKVCLAILRELPARERPRFTWEVARQYARAREVGLLDLRDPGPALAWGRRLARRRASRLAARFR